MAVPINVLAFTRWFYHWETNAGIQKHLKQIMYAVLPVYSSTIYKCPETILRWPTWNGWNPELFIFFFSNQPSALMQEVIQLKQP